MFFISSILRNLKNLIPYLLFIAVYFFFVNLEASKVKKSKINSEVEIRIPDTNTRIDSNNLRISIPVIPYRQ